MQVCNTNIRFSFALSLFVFTFIMIYDVSISISKSQIQSIYILEFIFTSSVFAILIHICYLSEFQIYASQLQIIKH